MSTAGIDSSLSGKGMHVALIFRSTGHSEVGEMKFVEKASQLVRTYYEAGKLSNSDSIIHMDNHHDIGHRDV